MNQESPAHIPDLFRFLSTYTCFISTLIMNHDNTTHTYICNEWKNGKVAKISEKNKFHFNKNTIVIIWYLNLKAYCTCVPFPRI